jgi:hypothetical protein
MSLTGKFVPQSCSSSVRSSSPQGLKKRCPVSTLIIQLVPPNVRGERPRRVHASQGAAPLRR